MIYRLLKIELRKILNYRTFLISIVLYFGLLGLIFFSAANIKINTSGGSVGLSSIYEFPNIWHNITYFASWFTPLPAIIVILLISNEYSFRTIRQNIIDGLSRFQYFTAKFIVNLFISISVSIFVFLLAIAAAVSLSENQQWDLFTKKMSFLPAFFLQNLGFLSFAMLVSIIIRKQGMSIIIFLIYYFMAEGIISLSLRNREMPDDYWTNIIADYLPLKSFSGLIQNPFLGDFVGIKVPEYPETSYYIMSIIYIIIFSGISYLLLEKTSV